MKTQKKEYSIYDILKRIHQNTIILPSIQRDFVWTKQQVLALFDSIMLGYPISTFLFWNIKDFDFSKNTYFYQFLKEVSFNFQGKAGETISTLIDSNIVDEDTIAVLDGQQRLTSLYVTLFGQAKIKEKYGRSSSSFFELYLDVNSGSSFFDDEELQEDDDDKAIKENLTYTFVFQLSANGNPDKKKWFKVKDILKLKETNDRENGITNMVSVFDEALRESTKKNLSLLSKRIFDDKVINVSELSECDLDEALEIFVRFNRGGSQLSKSDLIFSTIQSRWSDAKNKIEGYLKDINGSKYKFSKDFIVRLALVLFGNNTDIQKTLVNNEIVKQLKNNWNTVMNAVNTTIEFLSKDLGITGDREISSYVSIIPIVYSVYNKNNQVENENDVKKYIYRSLILNIFSQRTNALLVDLKTQIRNSGFLISIEDIENKIVNFKVGDEKLEQILDSEKSFTTQLTLFLMGNNNVFHNRDGSEYHQDHIHASALFDDNNKRPYAISEADWVRWGKMKNRLPNLQLLKGKSNQSKSKKQLTEWLGADDAPSENEFREALNLPDDLSLRLKDFDEFYNHRRELLKAQLKKMLL